MARRRTPRPTSDGDEAILLSMATINIAALSSEERLRLLEEPWDSRAETPEAFPLTGAQQAELDLRLDELAGC